MTNSAASGYTALVVDDDPAIREVLVEILQDVGLATTSFELGQPALLALIQNKFDLLLIDQWLPDINGLQICAAAQARYGDAAIVVMVTADPRVERHITALTTCADDVVQKPFDIDVLTARIEAKFRRRELAAG